MEVLFARFGEETAGSPVFGSEVFYTFAVDFEELQFVEVAEAGKCVEVVAEGCAEEVADGFGGVAEEVLEVLGNDSVGADRNSSVE